MSHDDIDTRHVIFAGADTASPTDSPHNSASDNPDFTPTYAVTACRQDPTTEFRREREPGEGFRNAATNPTRDQVSSTPVPAKTAQLAIRHRAPWSHYRRIGTLPSRSILRYYFAIREDLASKCDLISDPSCSAVRNVRSQTPPQRHLPPNFTSHCAPSRATVFFSRIPRISILDRPNELTLRSPVVRSW